MSRSSLILSRLIDTPAITSGPIIDPRPASSTPQTIMDARRGRSAIKPCVGVALVIASTARRRAAAAGAARQGAGRLAGRPGRDTACVSGGSFGVRMVPPAAVHLPVRKAAQVRILGRTRKSAILSQAQPYVDGHREGGLDGQDDRIRTTRRFGHARLAPRRFGRALFGIDPGGPWPTARRPSGGLGLGGLRRAGCRGARLPPPVTHAFIMPPHYRAIGCRTHARYCRWGRRSGCAGVAASACYRL